MKSLFITIVVLVLIKLLVPPELIYFAFIGLLIILGAVLIVPLFKH